MQSTTRVWIGCLVFLLGATGCMSRKTRYYINGGGRYELRTESYDGGLGAYLTRQTGVTTTVTSGDNAKIQSTGYGFQVGITEDVEKMFSSEINFFYVWYQPSTYTFNVQGSGTVTQSIRPVALGLDAKIGWKFWWLRPQLSYRAGSLRYTNTVQSGSATPVAVSGASSLYVIGGGLALHVPLGKSLRMVAQGDYQVPLFLPDGVSVNNLSAQAGLEILLGEVSGK